MAREPGYERVRRTPWCRTTAGIWAAAVMLTVATAPPPVQALPDDDCTLQTTVLSIVDHAVGGS